jgi:hypothetical protein
MKYPNATVAESDCCVTRSVVIETDLVAGTSYTLWVCTFNPNEEADFVVDLFESAVGAVKISPIP